jgi:ankyrin repeat domain-containing protein 50
MKSCLNLMKATQISINIPDWLNAPDTTIDYNEALAKRYQHTGLWLVQGAAFNEWLSKDNSSLWIDGFAGCGKSVLCSTAIDYIFQHRRSNPRIGMVFFCFTFTDKSKQDASALLLAFLWQLSSQLKNANADLVRLKAEHSDGTPPLLMLLKCLRQLVQEYDDVFIIVGESPKGTARDQVLDALKSMRKWSLGRLHLFITSRGEPDIRESLVPSLDEDVAMKNEGIGKDFANFISGGLDQDYKLRK